jgi:hypothetical protein
MREHHPTLIEILGREDAVRSASEGGETPGPADLILAADSPGHLLLTGKLGCEQEELARIIHKISKRRRQPIVEIDHVPDDRKGQNAIVKHKARKATLVLHLGKNRKRLDPVFVSAMFSPGYQIRVGRRRVVGGYRLSWTGRAGVRTVSPRAWTARACGPAAQPRTEAGVHRQRSSERESDGVGHRHHRCSAGRQASRR